MNKTLNKHQRRDHHIYCQLITLQSELRSLRDLLHELVHREFSLHSRVDSLLEDMQPRSKRLRKKPVILPTAPGMAHSSSTTRLERVVALREELERTKKFHRAINKKHTQKHKTVKVKARYLPATTHFAVLQE